MRRGRVFFYLAVIVILALVAVFVVWQKFLQPAANPSNPVSQVQPTPVNLVSAVVVTQRIPRGNILDEKVVGTIQIPKDLFIQGMFSNITDVAGKRAKFDLDSGIPLTSGMLVDSADQLSSTGSNAALSIPRWNGIGLDPDRPLVQRLICSTARRSCQCDRHDANGGSGHELPIQDA